MGQRLDAYSVTHLLGPLGISVFEWQMITANVVFASGDLRLRPRDMAKIGLLFLNRGRWNGTSVVSSDWVAAATARAVKPDGASSWADGCGYGWWRWDLGVGTRTHRMYMAAGWGGQWIIVSPDGAFVFVSTGRSYFDPTPMPADRLLVEYVLPAIQ